MLPVHLPRRIEAVIRQRLLEAPVVALLGPRAVGKSTLLAALAADTTSTVVNLDALPVRRTVARDPALFVERLEVVFIDEFQRVPELLDAIKVSLGHDYRPGRFVITGSTSFFALPAGTQSLTGRILLESVLPFSQGELAGNTETFVDVALTDPDSLRGVGSGLNRASYIERICAGGMPPTLRMGVAERERWLATYANQLVRRDVAELAKVRRGDALRPVLGHLATRTAQVLNVTAIGRAVGLDNHTTNAYIQLFEDLFVVRRLAAWGRTLRSRVVGHPKVHMVDTGLAARLMRLTPHKLAGTDPASLSEFGHLFETFVVNEILKQVSWSERAHVDDAGHWRTHDGHEVDLLIESHDGDVTAFEIKASREVRDRDTRGLVALRQLLGDRFHAGFVVTTGDTTARLADRIYTVPAQRLWESIPAKPPPA